MSNPLLEILREQAVFATAEKGTETTAEYTERVCQVLAHPDALRLRAHGSGAEVERYLRAAADLKHYEARQIAEEWTSTNDDGMFRYPACGSVPKHAVSSEHDGSKYPEWYT